MVILHQRLYKCSIGSIELKSTKSLMDSRILWNRKTELQEFIGIDLNQEDFRL